MTKVQLDAVRKEFGAFVAIKNIDLEIESGELVALLGPSGCGKTTTLRMIAGLERPTTGTILFDGVDVSDQTVQERNVGMVFQRYALFPHMTVERNVAFGLKVRGVERSEINSRLEEILDTVQLTEFRHRFPAQLSGGQMQRVAIARTLITQPSVLMLDEPLANLDTKLRVEMRRFIRDLQQRFGITTIFVTHDQVEAMELADRVAVIFGGHLAQYDTPQTLYRQPANLDVADFMGATNIIPGRMAGTELADVGISKIAVKERPTFNTGDKVQIMLRSESIDMLTEQPAAPALSGNIVFRDFFGANVTYTVDCSGTHINVSEQARRLVDVGATVWLDIAPERVWLMHD